MLFSGVCAWLGFWEDGIGFIIICIYIYTNIANDKKITFIHAFGLVNNYLKFGN